MENIIRVYDQHMKKLAYLQNAYNIGYELTLNELWYASFTLPADDPKNQYCQPFYYVEIYDGRERIELFRIMPSTLTRSTKGDIVYRCEHVLATLLDDVLFKYHQIGGGSIGTVQVLRYILDRQLTPRWQLGVCDYDRRFQYKWENENLLAALFSVPQPFDERYRWEFDTTGSIWRIHLRKLSAKFKADIIYRKNMTEIQKEVDPTSIVTRLYCLGYGEGDNQLGIESINDGVPYLQANGEATTWGIKSSILVDRRFESAETLKAYGQALLNELKNPYKSYSVRAVDLHRKTPDKYERFFPGDIVRIIDKEDGIIEDLPIVRVSKSDITGRPGDVQVEIANKSRDIAGSISELQDRTRINEVYAQGATNLDSYTMRDNFDPERPAKLRFHIAQEAVNINKILLNYEFGAFRGYSRGIKGGGAIIQSTSEGGAHGDTTPSTGAHRHRVFRWAGGGIWEDISYFYTQPAGFHNHAVSNDFPSGEHNHGNPDYIGTGQHSHNLGTDQTGNHQHQQIVPLVRTWDCQDVNGNWQNIGIGSPMNSADIWTYESAGQHSHGYSVPAHAHEIEMPDHEHEIEFGIFEGPTPTAVTVKVDGNTIPGLGLSENDVDVIPYLSKDDGGKIVRGWHEIEFWGNSLGHVEATLHIQLFMQSRGEKTL